MTSLEGEAPPLDPLPSKGESSKTRMMPTCSRKKKKMRVSRAPRVQLRYTDDGSTSKEVTLKCIKTALSFWNKKSQSKKKKGPEYELVDALSCIRVPFPVIFHCNFTARPKHETGAESELFFAELRYKKEKDGNLTLTCRICSIVGPCGTVTGLRGCQMCKLNPDAVQHPRKGRFFKKEGGPPSR